MRDIYTQETCRHFSRKPTGHPKHLAQDKEICGKIAFNGLGYHSSTQRRDLSRRLSRALIPLSAKAFRDYATRSLSIAHCIAATIMQLQVKKLYWSPSVNGSFCIIIVLAPTGISFPATSSISLFVFITLICSASTPKS